MLTVLMTCTHLPNMPNYLTTYVVTNLEGPATSTTSLGNVQTLPQPTPNMYMTTNPIAYPKIQTRPLN